MWSSQLIQEEFQSLSANYFNSAYFGPLPRRAQSAAQEAIALQANPVNFPYSEWRPLPDELRKSFSRLLGLDVENFSHHGSTSEVISYVSLGFDWKAKGSVVLMEGEYPSDVLPWMLNRERMGYEIQFLPEQDFCHPQRLADKLPVHCQVLNLSHVMFNTGRRNDLEAIGKICRERDILLVVDVTQSLGARQLTRSELENCDVVVGSTYKWLLSPYGHAFAYWSKKALESVDNTHLSWQSFKNAQNAESLLDYTTEALPGARRFDRGQAPNLIQLKAMKASLGLFEELSLPSIQGHIEGLMECFWDNFKSNDLEVVTPKEACAGIICLKQRAGDPQELAHRLREKQIDCSVRQGNLRLSFHLFNTQEEVTKLLEALR